MPKRTTVEDDETIGMAKSTTVEDDEPPAGKKGENDPPATRAQAYTARASENKYDKALDV